MVRASTIDELVLVGTPETVGQALERAAGGGQAEQRSFMVSHQGRSLKFGLAKTAAPAGVALERLIGWSVNGRVPVLAEANRSVLHPRVRSRQGGGISLDPWDWAENPWDWVENPWDWVENPWDWVENPLAAPLVAPAGHTPAEGEAMFWQQGALQKLGLTAATGARNPLLADHLGEGVLVGLFDALPAKPPTLPWLILQPAQGNGHPQSSGDRDLSDHGLLCASLVHAVAPRATVHLYEVCGRDGVGRLFPLLEALNSFIDLAAGKPAVISLSLGSPDASGSAALRLLLQKATDMGMVVCAAAGNLGQWAHKASSVQSAQVPATFPNVIAVSAANLADQRATYSQRGDIAAPGGEDLGQNGPDDADDIIGMGVSVGTSGFVRMDAGTSFATPLVAGAAALLMAGQFNRDANTYLRILAALKAGARHPAAPGEEMLSNTGLGAGILYLPSLFDR